MIDALAQIAKSVEQGKSMMASVQSQGAGRFGEFLTERALTHGGLPGRMRTWSNVLVPKDGAVVDETELDVLMLHERGVFVFESKNYSGWIFGSEDQRMWTQSLNRATKTRFYNPIMQNSAHVKALSRRLVVPERDFVSYIVFSDRCELKKVPTNGERFRICHRSDLLRLVRDDLDRRDVAFNGLQFSTLERRVEELASASTMAAKRQHAQDVRAASSGDVCPWCGGKLVERSGRYGTFLGCERFPRCRFTRNV